jgi:hypothetical protein
LRAGMAPPTMFSGVLGCFIEPLDDNHPCTHLRVRLPEMQALLSFTLWMGGAFSPPAVCLSPVALQSVLNEAVTAYLLKFVLCWVANDPS